MINTVYEVQTMKHGTGTWIAQRSVRNLKEAVAEHGRLSTAKSIGFSRELEPTYAFVRVIKIVTSTEEVEV